MSAVSAVSAVSAPFRLSSEPLDVVECLRAVSHPGAGGIDVFVGTVRDNSGGQSVSVLEYEAYASMAEKEMARIGAELTEAFPGIRVSALHRIGRLAVGDVAVVCAASAPHRDEAFRACRRLIDDIKARVPIWKREHAEGGVEWVGWQDARVAQR
ncbi:MAG TPA: molybdenum cofactor biosynthesis protein MoaE [Polyangiaceae bacterium]|nr:molybdenum cofactor biosynthesis protein MoaE [Polyangiaceae bacterium]